METVCDYLLFKHETKLSLTMKRFLLYSTLSFQIMFLASICQAREWSDSTGKMKFNGDLIASDDKTAILQREEDKELAAYKISDLSKEDQEYLKSKEATDLSSKNLDQPQTWVLKSGIKIYGRLVGYARGDVVIQRRRGRMYVNDRVFENLPEVYQKLVYLLIEKEEDIDIPNRAALQDWLLSLRGEPKTYLVEGVILELKNGDEYKIPFWAFTPEELEYLKPGWKEWMAAHDEYQRQQEESFRLQTEAAMQKQNAKTDRQIALANLQLQAIQAGITSAWEVTLYPVAGNPSRPKWVMVTGRNSAEATQNALKQNPGFTAGPVRRVSR